MSSFVRASLGSPNGGSSNGITTHLDACRSMGVVPVLKHVVRADELVDASPQRRLASTGGGEQLRQQVLPARLAQHVVPLLRGAPGEVHSAGVHPRVENDDLYVTRLIERA